MVARISNAAPKISEKQFQSQVVQLATICGWKVYHTHDSRRSQKGFLDLFCIHPCGWCFAAELKVPPRKPTPEQREWLAGLIRCGIEAYVWFPKDWPEIERTLRHGPGETT